MLSWILLIVTAALEIFRRLPVIKNPIYWVEQLDEDPLSGRAEALTTVYKKVLGFVGAFFALKLIFVMWLPGIVILHEIFFTMIIARVVQFAVAGGMVVYMEGNHNPINQVQKHQKH